MESRWSKKQIRRQKLKWFGNAFLISWLMIFFLAGFLWIAAGSGGEELHDPIIQAGVTTDTRVTATARDTAAFITVFGKRAELSINTLNTALQTYKQYSLLVPPQARLAVDLIALWMGAELS